MTKGVQKQYSISLGTVSDSGLTASGLIDQVELSQLFNNARRGRHPAGIYNASIARVTEKLTSLCTKLEPALASKLDDVDKNGPPHRDIVDYCELALYSAAEHVDDLMGIAQGFFPNEKARKKTGYAAFEEEVKLAKRHIAMIVNKIKHQQLRLRIFVLEYSYHSDGGLLYGYYLEDVEDGVLGVNKEVHAKGNVFSLTSLVWEIIVFLLRTSDALSVFLKDRGVTGERNPAGNTSFLNAVTAGVRLPLYSFDEEHIFSRFPVSVTGPLYQDPRFASGLHGSIARPWSVLTDPKFGRHAIYTTSDGHTRTFSLVGPKQVSLRHWELTS